MTTSRVRKNQAVVVESLAPTSSARKNRTVKMYTRLDALARRFFFVPLLLFPRKISSGPSCYSLPLSGEESSSAASFFPKNRSPAAIFLYSGVAQNLKASRGIRQGHSCFGVER